MVVRRPEHRSRHRLQGAFQVRQESFQVRFAGGCLALPREREPDLVVADVAEGLVSPDAARRVYGVVMEAAPGYPRLDPGATASRRDAIRGDRLGGRVPRPATRVAGQFTLWENMWDERFVRSYRAFERWSTDTLPLAGEYFRETIKELIWENRLHRNELEIAGRRVDLRAIEAPMLHAMAEHDHIVPYDAAKPLIDHVGSADKEEIILKGGHVSLVAGPNAVKRLWPRLDAWLATRST